MNKEDKRRFQAITGSVMCLGQVTRYDIGYAVNQLARAMCKPSKAHMAAAKHLLRYLAGTTNLAITYKRGGFKLTAFSDANWGNNPDNGKSTSSYIAFLSDGPVSFKELVNERRISIHYGGSTCSHRYQASQQAQAPVPHQTIGDFKA